MSEPKKVEHKLLLQILSVLVAIVIWFVILYTENPALEVTISDIRIQYTGESQLFEDGLILMDKAELPAASVEVRGSRSDLMDSMNEITASVDLSNITAAGEYRLPVNYELPTGSIYINRKRLNAVTVTVENVAEKDVPVQILQIGADRDRSKIIQSVPEVDKVHVRGAKSDVDQIERALVSVDVTTLEEHNTQKYSFILADGNDTQVTPVNELVTDIEVISIQNNVFLRKTVPLSVTFPEAVFEEYAVHIESLSKTELDIGVADLEGAPDQIEVEYNGSLSEDTDTYTVELTAPEGVYIPDESVEMKASVTKKTVQTLDVPVEVINSSSTYSLAPASVSITLRGPADKLNTDNVKATADLSGLPVGVHSVSVEVQSNDVDVAVLNGAMVTVTIY